MGDDPTEEAEAMQSTKDVDEEIANWAEGISATPEVRVEVFRVEPKTWEGRKIDGKVGSFNELPLWEDVRDAHGGGRFRLVLKRPDAKGRLVYFGCWTIAIAGFPLVPASAPLAFDKGTRDAEVRKIVFASIEERYETRIRRLEASVGSLKSAKLCLIVPPGFADMSRLTIEAEDGA